MANLALPGTALTRREREVAALAVAGMTAREVGRALSVSERTVHSHLRAAYVKTGARNRVTLMNWLAARPRG
jgi:DNA-binding CsgD family transcriptional regulator